MSVAPNGRIDAIWNDTRNTGQPNLSEFYYTFSVDPGNTWSANDSISPVWDSYVGWPNQSKIGDYYDMISGNGGANLAWAATFHGEQDVYFLRIPAGCNGNGVEDDDDLAAGAPDCNGNLILDACEGDCNNSGIPDACELAAGTSNDCNVNDVPDECGLGDIDGDEIVGLPDHTDFTNCMTGPCGALPCAMPPEAPVCCTILDFDGNGSIDLRDSGSFQNAFGGP